jgi:DNA-binding transcriptional MerR regulator
MPAEPNPAEPLPTPQLLRIQEVAAEVGATTRAIRYYEEIGLIRPAARSEGDYRLYDASDVERIRHIRELRDTAGISLADISQLLEDEDHRAANREAYRQTEDPTARAEILTDSIERVDRAIAILSAKADRLNAMIADSHERRQRLLDKLAALETPAPDPGSSTRPTRAP